MSTKITEVTNARELRICAILVVGQALFAFAAVFTFHGTLNLPFMLGVAFAALAAACFAGLVYFGRNVDFRKEADAPPIVAPPEPEPKPRPEPAPIRKGSGTELLHHNKPSASAATEIMRRDTAILLSWSVNGAKDNAAIHKYPASIGRGEDCDVVVSDGTVSRRHAVITFENGQLYVEDNDSGNGTFLNGERIIGKTAFSLGDTLLFGRVSARAELL